MFGYFAGSAGLVRHHNNLSRYGCGYPENGVYAVVTYTVRIIRLVLKAGDGISIYSFGSQLE